MPLAVLTLTLAVLFRDPFAGDWDALDYTVLALHGMPSSMLLGRMLFIFTNHFAFEIAHTLFNVQTEHAYLLFKLLVIAESPLVVVACWNFTRELTNSLHAATLAALTIALSPIFIVYSGQAMTEIPSLLLLVIALTIHLRGLKQQRTSLVIVGAALLGLGVNVRELAAFYGVWLVIAPFACGAERHGGGRWTEGASSVERFGFDKNFKFDSRAFRLSPSAFRLVFLACVVFCVCAFAPFALWVAFDIRNYRAWWLAWFATSQLEQALHPVALGNFKTLLIYFLITAPVLLLTIPFALFDEWRRKGFSILFALGAVGLFANLILVLHYSVTINPRYMLTGLPALVPIAGSFLWLLTSKFLNTRRAFVCAILIVAASNIALGKYLYENASLVLQRHAMTAEYGVRLKLLPPDAVIIAGNQTVSVDYWRGIGQGNWDTISTGSGFPHGHLNEMIETYLRANRHVFLDTDTRLWSAHGWQGIETQAIVQLPAQFHFKKISETIYELRPLDDETARDVPNLEKLLEN
ncbi:MAG: hypothetical protein NVSMB56_08280 [Pyrinomonadaceae bacterium]